MIKREAIVRNPIKVKDGELWYFPREKFVQEKLCRDLGLKPDPRARKEKEKDEK